MVRVYSSLDYTSLTRVRISAVGLRSRIRHPSIRVSPLALAGGASDHQLLPSPRLLVRMDPSHPPQALIILVPVPTAKPVVRTCSC